MLQELTVTRQQGHRVERREPADFALSRHGRAKIRAVGGARLVHAVGNHGKLCVDDVERAVDCFGENAVDTPQLAFRGVEGLLAQLVRGDARSN